MVTARDLASNTATQSVSFTIDRTPPTVTIAGLPSIPSPWTEGPVTPGVTVSESLPSPAVLTVNGTPHTAGTAMIDEGAYTLAATATDCAGNTGTVTRSFIIDRSAPVVTIAAPLSGAVITTPTIEVIGHVADATPIDAFHEGNISTVLTLSPTGTFIFDVPVVLGSNTVRVQAVDALGHTTIVERVFEGCRPTTCAAQRADCGIIDDGCGGTVACGSYAAGETCGGGGFANVCGGAPLPDPTTVAPALDPTVSSGVARSMAFLYSGPEPIQRGVSPATIEVRRAAVVSGRVLERTPDGHAGPPLAGARVTILDRPQYGWTFTRGDGRFDLVVNGSGDSGAMARVLVVESALHLSAHRKVWSAWQSYQTAEDVLLLPRGPGATRDFTGAGPMQIVESLAVPSSDLRGARQGVLLIPSPQMF